MGLLLSKNTVSVYFFSDYCARNFFFTGELMRFQSMGYLFNLGSLWLTYV